MFGGTSLFFSKLFGTLAVILVIAAFVGSTDLLSKFLDEKRSWKYSVIAGVLGGLFGIYGNISGVELRGAVISVRDMGPMLAGFIGGPIGGIIAGLTAGLHRLTMGGLTAQACVVATCFIGLACGIVSSMKHEAIKRPQWAFVTGMIMEASHLGIVLIMVKPFETAWSIVRQIAIPFILVNAAGFAALASMISYMEKQRNLSIERSRLQSELEISSVIQHSLLPTINEEYPGREEIDVSASMDAAKEVGGDFYDVFFVDSHRLAFVIGDVSGKGVPAAIFMASAKITLQNCIRDIPTLSAAVETANNAICARNEAEMFVTIWVGILDLQSGELTFVSAGHNPAVRKSPEGTEYMRIRNGLVLAGMSGVKYKEHTAKLNKGDSIFLYTDGITEAQTAGKELYGEDRLLEMLSSLPAGTAAHEIIEAVRESVDEFVGGNDQFDDMTMLCFRYI
ncbi:MAG: SpoIIE family protein phosphatase [Clostridia bacterium]|nr:SpoIIE family protein phosphatase [Clostridia bacterium]